MNEFLNATVVTFQAQKKLAEGAWRQVREDRCHVALDNNTNSLAVMVQHVAGNLKSRWTEFLAADGEKPWRNRDEEFVEHQRAAPALMELWEEGWRTLFCTLQALSEADLQRTVTIRGESLSVPLAIQRSLAHTAYHVGQIVQLARHLAGDSWETLTLPRKGR
ncbi:MAG: DUF1572 family protein [Candidatus Xenobia bacterium]